MVAIKAVNSGMIDVLLYPFNLTSHAKEEDQSLLQACVEQDVGLVAMKPYGGGRLLRAKGDGRESPLTPIQCLHYLLSLPVSATVPGVSNAEHLFDALCYWEASERDRMYDSFLPYIHTFLAGECTYCSHCLPCPQGIPIGHTIFMVDEVRWSLFDEYAQEYAALEVKASACVECGDCVERCPFDVDIIAKMQEATALFETAYLPHHVR
jgi:predicted aldo/keto reductase-like oxidoreductase